VIVYINDLHITNNNITKVNWIKVILKTQFKMLDLGLISRYLGLEFKQGFHGIFLNQRSFSTSLLTKFGMLNYNPSNIPLVEILKLQLDMNSPTYYKSLVGKLQTQDLTLHS
jgi:hypothetical protein